MHLSDLQLFCDLIETGSFTRAAERNFLSQSAVSQRVRSLERQLEQTLVERGRGRSNARPTEAGRLLYDGARSLLREAAELEARVRGAADEVAGTVRVATVYSVGLHALPGRLKPFLAAHPKVNVHLEYSQTGKIYEDVLGGAVDVGIVAYPSERVGIDLVPFGVEEMVVICAPESPLASEPEMALGRLEGEPLIAFAEGIPTRRLTDEKLREAGIQPHIEMAFDNIETIKNLVEIGSGIALVPAHSVRQEVREGALAVVRIREAERFYRPSALLLRAGRSPRAAVRAFVETMRAETTEPTTAQEISQNV